MSALAAWSASFDGPPPRLADIARRRAADALMELADRVDNPVIVVARARWTDPTGRTCAASPGGSPTPPVTRPRGAGGSACRRPLPEGLGRDARRLQPGDVDRDPQPERGRVHRGRGRRAGAKAALRLYVPGGRGGGVNVARVAHVLGVDVTVLVLVGGCAGAQLLDLLARRA